MKKLMMFALASALSLTSISAVAASNPTVGGAPMLQTKNIVENAMNSQDHTTSSLPLRPLAWWTH